MADASFIPGMDVGISSDTPSGVGLVNAGDQVNAPIAATTGQSAQTSNSVISGTDRNTPKGPPIFRWDKYATMYNAYFGMGGFYDGTALYKSQVEKDDQFLERRATTQYRNFLRQIVDATYVPVFSSGATRETKVNGVLDEDGTRCPLWNSFLDNVDCRHHHIQSFTKKIIRHTRILGVSFVVVDNYPNLPENTQIALKARLFPYVYMRLPQQVEASQLKINEFCQIEQICFREDPERVLDIKTNQYVMEPRWKLWTENYSVKLKKNINTGQFVEIPGTKVVYNLGEPPIFPVMSSEVEDGTVLPHPDFYNVMKSNWALYNIDSCQMRLIRAQMFPILCMPQTKDNDPSPKQAVNPLQGFYMPANGDGMSYEKPFYLAPPVGPYTELTSTIEALKEDIFRQAGQAGVTGVKQAKSGVSQAFDFQAQEYVLKETAKMAKHTEESIARLFQKYVISEIFDYDVIYEDSYAPTDKNSDIQLYSSYIQEDPGPLGRALALEKMTRDVFDDLDDEVVQPVIDEIKEHAQDEQKIPDQVDDVEMTPEEEAAAEAEAMNKQVTAPLDNFPKKKTTKFVNKNKFSIKKVA